MLKSSFPILRILDYLFYMFWKLPFHMGSLWATYKIETGKKDDGWWSTINPQMLKLKDGSDLINVVE